MLEECAPMAKGPYKVKIIVTSSAANVLRSVM